MSKLIDFIKKPSLLFLFLGHRGFFKHMSDAEYLKIAYKINMGKELDLEHPVTFNEKLQWLKVYNQNPEYTKLVDKYGAKEYVADRIGDKYIIPTLGVWDRFEDIDFDALPNQFVLKCTHDSGGLVICRDKSKLDIQAAKKKISACLKHNYYWGLREWPYKNVKPRIIAEKFMQDDDDAKDLTDYKFFCFDGTAECVMVCIERSTGSPKFYFFDQKWELKRYNKRGLAAADNFTLPMPPMMPQMFDLAEKLSKGLPFARVDLYACKDQIYFGEITFFPDSGFDPNILPETDKRFGELINLPAKVTKEN